MSELDRLIFDDLIMLFFGREKDLDGDYWRDYFLNGDEEFTGYREAFPENEVCDFINERYVTQICGCCSVVEYLPANYIQDSK